MPDVSCLLTSSFAAFFWNRGRECTELFGVAGKAETGAQGASDDVVDLSETIIIELLVQRATSQEFSSLSFLYSFSK